VCGRRWLGSLDFYIRAGDWTRALENDWEEAHQVIAALGEGAGLVKHRKVDLEQIKRDKEALEVKMGEEVGDEDLQRLAEFVGVISRHKRNQEV
jgi:hypothetical protein